MKWLQKLLSDSEKLGFFVDFIFLLLALYVHGISIFLYSKLESPNLFEILGVYFILYSFCFDTIFLFSIQESFCFLQFVKLFVYVVVSRFTDIYIYEYYLIIIQYCVSIFWHFNIVSQQKQKELCDYSKLFEYRKYIDKQRKEKILNYITYYITFVVFLAFPLFTKKIVESAIILIPTFYISFRSIFFSSLYNHLKNEIPCNELDFKSLEAMESPLTISSILIPVLTLILCSSLNYITCGIVLFGAIIILVQDLYHLENIRLNGIKQYQKIFLLFLAIGVMYFIYWITTKKVSELDKSNLSGLIIPVISAVFIFNFSAICYLVQENYHKYNSVLLIKESFNFTTLLFTIIIPAGFVLSLIFFDEKSINLVFWSVVATIYSLCSSIWLLYRVRFLLNDRKILLRLISNLSKDDINAYCKNVNINTENPIDTMQKVLTLIIKNNDVNLAEDSFNLLFKWIALNLDCIYEDSNNYWRIQQNRFNKFLIGLSQEISKADNYVMRQNFVYSMYECVLLKSEIKQIKRYELIYSTLESFIKSELEKNDRYSEKVAENSFHILISMVPKYLHYMKCNECPIAGYSYLTESEEWYQFYEIVIRSVKECVDFAVEKNRIDFLKSTYLVSRIFEKYEEPFVSSLEDNKFLWNDNAYRYWESVSNIYYRIYTKIFDEQVIRHIEMEYRQFAYLITVLNYSFPAQRAIFNSFYNSYSAFICELIEKKRVFSSKEFFEILCEPVFDRCSCQAYFNSYMKLFFFATNKTLNLYSGNNELLNSHDLMRIIGHIEQMKKYLQEKCKFKFEKDVLDKFDEYEKKYSEIFANYTEYKKNQNLLYSEYINAINHI